MSIEYLNLIIFSFFSMLLTLFLIYLNYLLVLKKGYIEKTSTYECGFQPFKIILEQFEMRYYIVALLFLIFDLELMFLLPWIIALNHISLIGFFIGLLFIFILLIGFIYEWLKEGLEWD